MKKILLITFSLILSTSVFAQFPGFGWAHKFSSDFFPTASAIDASGNYYIATSIGDGWGAVNMNPTGSAFTATISGQYTSIVAKYDMNGNFVWMKDFAAVSSSISPGVTVNSIAVNTTGELYLTGTFEGTFDFDFSAGSANLTAVGLHDIFILKLDNLGNYVWVKQIGSLNEEAGMCLTVDSNNDLLVSGNYTGTVDFDPNGTIVNMTSQGPKDIFIIKLSPLGNLSFAKSVGTDMGAVGKSIATDLSNNIYLTGQYNGTGDFNTDAGTTNITSNGGTDVFILKLNTLGSFAYVKTVGGINDDSGNAIKIDNAGNVDLTGTFSDVVDFDYTGGTSNVTSQGGTDIFIMQIDASGNQNWVKTIGGTSDEIAYTLAKNSTNELIIGGRFSSSVDFDPSAGTAIITTSSGYYDGFILKLDNTGTFVWAQNLQAGAADAGELSGIVVDNSNAILGYGVFYGTLDFDLTAGVQNLTSAAGFLFIAKWVDLSTSIAEHKKSAFSIYPNPTNSLLNITTSEATTISILNVLGQEVMNSKIQGTTILSFSNFEKGIYFVKDLNSGKTIKFIKN